MAELGKDHKNYRDAGVAFSLTLISISSAFIWWARKTLEDGTPMAQRVKILALFLTGISGVCILSSFVLQWFNYEGYKNQARAGYGQSTQDQANKWFEKEDIAFYVSGIIFIVVIVLGLVLFIYEIA